ncbi:MAG: transglutaminase-like domain-containing protein [Chloroflexi bacterium]|nr:transglutaminase-like domain-containing protein [Chloroflexota bacterium]
MNQPIPDYYTEHSPFTDPGAYAAYFDDFPNDLPGIVRAIQGLIIPPYTYTVAPHGFELADIKDAGFGVRRMEDFIAKLLDINSAPLNQPRPPRQRLGVNCRNFATLLVSLLRHQGIPARERIGFEGYLGDDIFAEHRIAQVWNMWQGKWFYIDAFVDPPLKAARDIDINTLDIVEDKDFWPAGLVWLAARAGNVNPVTFGDGPEDIGFPAIRYALLHDFDALNKFEVLGNDVWGALIEKPEADLSADDWAFLDEVARLTLNPDVNFAAMTALHMTSNYGEQVRAIASAMDALRTIKSILQGLPSVPDGGKNSE